MSAFDESETCRNILESLPTGLCVVDLHKKIIFWSEGADRITGHLRHEVIGHSCVAEPLLHCDQPGCEFCREECPLAITMKTSRSAVGCGFLHHKAGHEVPVRIHAVPVHNTHGSIIGAVETFEELQPAANAGPREDGPNLAAGIDEVTGLAGYVMMQSHLLKTLAAFTEGQAPFGILCFRLEGLNHFRASFGPEAASSLLRGVARTIASSLWKTDLVGRWTDDQFLAILHGCQQDAMCSVRERLRRMLANNSIAWWGERRSLPVSIGQATAQPDDNLESLLKRARKSLDAALAGPVQAPVSAAEPSSGSQ
jgi:diguanylate cyclase (GGDEF)-like protein/PAS domain S-box-containing protein